MNASVLTVDGVTKRFDGHTAVRNLSLQVPGGGIFGLLGPNGAGKSTTIRMIMNIIMPDEGRITVLGNNSASRELSQRIGYLPEERGLYPKMRVLDQLTFLGEAKGVARPTAKKKAAEWLERLGLGAWQLKRVQDLSKGMQQKVQFISALLHDPELVILDEPFSGLDPVNSQALRDVVVEIARRGHTVVFSTHIMEHAEKMCDRIAIIARGEKVVDGALSDVKRDFGGQFVRLAFTRHADRASRILQDRSLVAKAEDNGATAEAQLATGASGDQLLTALVREDVGISRFEVAEASLQAIFIAKVGSAAAPAAALTGE